MEKERVFIWGTGKNERTIRERFSDLLYSIEIIGYIDNDEKKHNTEYFGYLIYSPKEAVKVDYDRIIVCSTFFNDIEEQLINELHVSRGKIDNFRYFTKKRLINRYKGTNNTEIEKEIQYIQENRLEVFNAPFIEKYQDFHVEVCFDEVAGLFYVMHNLKRMYFSRHFKTENEVKWYYKNIMIEQDQHSPHRYLSDSFDVCDGDVVVDAGVAEGNFALDIVDRASKLYLIESDQDWIEALQYTFADYSDKVTIIPKMLTDFDGDRTTCLDSAIVDSVNFVKMDIEGCEVEALTEISCMVNKSERIKFAVCCYHNDYDEKLILEELNSYGLETQLTSGYMWYPVGAQQECYNPKLRRAVVRGWRN